MLIIGGVFLLLSNTAEIYSCCNRNFKYLTPQLRYLVKETTLVTEIPLKFSMNTKPLTIMRDFSSNTF